MRLGFSEKLSSIEGSGKHKFLYRLSKCLQSMGVKIDRKHPDVYLILPGHDSKKGCKNILRLDGLIINKDMNLKKNDALLKQAKKCDAVIYQNAFCKTAYENFLGLHHKLSTCIINGASTDEFLPRFTKKIFLACCRWRPHKRLSNIISGYLLAREKGLKSDLIVAGEVDIKVKNKHIKYVGWQNSDQLKQLLSSALATIHLTWIDWCPNSMVESIVAGCPVIYSNSGGHPLIANGCGIPISDIQWNFNVCDYYNPPKLSDEEISDAMLSLENNPIDVSNPTLSIENVAKEYISFFKKVLVT